MSVGQAITETSMAVIEAAVIRRRSVARQAVQRELNRVVAKTIHVKQVGDVERSLIRELAPFFAKQIKSATRELLALKSYGLIEKSVEDAAENLAMTIFNPSEWSRELIDRAFPIIANSMSKGALSILLSVGIDPRKKSVNGKSCPCGCGKSSDCLESFRIRKKQSTASEWLEREGLEPPPGVVTEFPQWMKDNIAEELRNTFSQDYWDEVSVTTQGDIERILKDGLQEGLSIRKMASQMASIFGPAYDKIRATRIARTESGHALNAGRNISINGLKQELGEAGQFVSKEWLSVLGNTTRDAHAGLDGVVADENGMFNLNGVLIPWPSHIDLPVDDRANCFPAGTLVQGDFVGAQRGWYDGVFTEIILSSGGRVTVTPNHPIVTLQGLIAASKVKPGCKVMVYGANVDRPFLSRSIGYDIDNEPFPIEHIFKAFLSANRRFGKVEVRGTQVDDFYGDGESFNGDVEIVRANWELLKDGEVGQFEKRGNLVFAFEPAELLAESCLGSKCFGSDGIGSTSSSFPSGSQCLLDVFRRFGITPTGSLAVGKAADFNVSLHKSAMQDGSSVSSFLRQSLQRHSRFVTFDDVVEIRNFYSSGYVYDLQSEYGLIVANDPLYTDIGIVTSNCQCTIVMALGVGAPEEEIQALMQEQAGPALTEEVVETKPRSEMSFAERLKTDKEAKDVVSRVKKIASEAEKEVAELIKERQRLEDITGEEWQGVIDAEDRLERGEITQEEFDRIAGPIDARANKRWERIEVIDNELGIIEGRNRDKALAELMLDRSERMDVIAEKRYGKFFGRDMDKVAKVYGKEFDAKMKEATGFLNQITRRNEELPNGVNTIVHRLKKGERAFFQSGSSNYDGVFVSSQSDVRSYVHEWGHRLEESLPNAEKFANEFRDLRISRSGTKATPMSDLVPTAGYSPDEIGNEDGWEKAFGERAGYVGKSYVTGQTEILSMGLDRMYTNPVTFARDDPEYFQFIVGILRGTL